MNLKPTRPGLLSVVRALFRWPSPRCMSVEDWRDLRDRARCLVRHIRETLPSTRRGIPNNSENVQRNDYLFVLANAIRMEQLLNPEEEAFGSEWRMGNACRHRSKQISKATREFVKAFDAIVVHYGWERKLTSGRTKQTGPSRSDRSEFQFRPETKDCSGRGTSEIAFSMRPEVWNQDELFGPPLMEQPPPAIDEDLLIGLEKAAQGLWELVLGDLVANLDPESKNAIVVAIFGSREKCAEAITRTFPEWSVQQIAQASGMNRTQIYRFAWFDDLREEVKQEGKAKLPRGLIVKDKETGQNHVEAVGRDPQLEDLKMNDDPNFWNH